MLPQRKSPRLPNYDYAQAGAYFITICTHRMQPLFGDIVNGTLQLSALGHLAATCWLALPLHLPTFMLDAYVIMPNHMHGIISIVPRQLPVDSTDKRSPSLSTAISQYKSTVTRYGGQILGATIPNPLWHTRFHDHIIRDEQDYARIATYVVNNPARWEEDRFNHQRG